MKVGEAIKALEGEGWAQVRQKGDHRQFRHPTKPGTVTVAGKLSADLKKGTWASIQRQAGLNGSRK
ncbi:MAG: type II toxin-antitoxin system HicA family toxin [Actinomycetota bacterium]|nr:type II toxin-antitoxin system HicA family toxin [Actinomycetota bacterium]